MSRRRDFFNTVLGAIAFMLIAGYFIAKCTSDDDRSGGQKSSKKYTDVECRQDLICWGPKWNATATVMCKKGIENLTLRSYRWTDSLLDSKMKWKKWLDIRKGHLTYFGDKLEMQNEFGAWTNYVYECDIDPENKYAYGFRMAPGKLP